MKSKSEETWEEQFDRITKDNDGQFGHNIEFTNAKKFLSKIANFSKLEVLDEFTIRVTLPPQMSDARDKTLLLLLTGGATPSDCQYNKKKDQLTVEWHF